MINNDDVSKIAKRDISCYKVVYSSDNINDNIYETFYQGTAVELGKTYNSEIHRKNSCYDQKVDQIEQGLHSFKLLSKAKKFINEQGVEEDCVVIKCSIPKGSEYYLGDFNGKNDSYASTGLKYICVV